MWGDPKANRQFSQINEQAEGNNKLKKSLKKLDRALDDVRSNLGETSHRRKILIAAGISALLSYLLTMKIMLKKRCNCSHEEK